jgi:hypothetical protein
LAWTGAVALVLGLLASPVFARLLPFGLDGQVAAFIMQTDRWNAGAALMKAQSPDAWRDLESAAQLLTPHSERFIECRRAGMFCTMVILGQTSTCDVAWLGHYVSTKVAFL